MPLKRDLVFNDAPNASTTIPDVVTVESSSSKPSKDLSKTLRPDAPIIEDWTSDFKDEYEIVSLLKQKDPSFVQTSEHVKTHRESNPMWNNAKRVNHYHSTRMYHPHSNRNVVPTAVLTRSGLVSLNAARSVSTIVPQTMVKSPRPFKHVVNKAHSPIRRPINHRPAPKNSNFHKKVTTVKVSKVNAVKDTKGNWVWKPKCIVLDHVSRFTSASMTLKQFDYTDALGRSNGCSSHMTKNISYLSDFKEINGGYAVFGGNPKGDPLGKFDGKADEGFLVGYSVNSKAFRVFNSRTRILQEILHINFLENEPNVSWSGPKWLFDIDVLTQSMNYQPVVAGNQPNHSAGIKENLVVDPQNTDVDATFDVKKNENEVHVSPSSSDKPKKHDEKAKREAKGKNMPALEDIIYSDDEEDVGAEADFFNMDTNISISPIPTTRVHKDYPVTQIIGELTSAPLTRSMARMGHTQEEGIDYEEVFSPVARIEAISLFLAYASFMGFMVYQMDFKSAFLYGTIVEEVYVCQPLGFEDPDYPDKVYKFSLTDSKSASTPIDTEKPLLKDHDGEDVDIHIYIVTMLELALIGSPQQEVVLDYRLISWQCKKQIVVATSSSEAEYVAVARCCA
nr:retrovirus-related Pol polyprotein from transposon TNT 1-94 [Tanacetum cinerariifolium]